MSRKKKEAPITASDVDIVEAAPQRRPMPDVTVSDLFNNDRTAILDQLNAKDPEYVHSYQYPHVDQLELERRGQERVVVGGKPIHHGGDPVVRTPREFAQKRSRLEHERSFAQVRNLARNPESLRKVAAPVTVSEKQ